MRIFAPESLLLGQMIKHVLADPAIKRLDACTLSEHPLVETMFNAQEPQETLIIGLHKEAQRLVEKATAKVRFRNKSSAFKKILSQMTGRSKFN